MSDLIQKLFPEGQRKLVMSLVTLVVGLVLNHFNALDEQMKQSLLAILAIFVTGNVMEHLADALKVLRGTKVGHIVEQLIPGDQGLDVPGVNAAKAPTVQAAVQRAAGPSVAQVASENASAAAQLASEAHDRISDLDKKIAVANQNITQIVAILNQMRGAANAPARPQAPTQPQS